MFARFALNWQLIFDGLLGLFSIFGFCPIKIDRKSPKYSNNFEVFNVILIISSFFHITVVIVLVFFACKAFSADDSEVGSFPTVLKFSIMALTHFVAIVESIVVRRNFVEIWMRVKQIDDALEVMLPSYGSILKTFYKETSRKIIVFLFMTVIIEFAIISNILDVSSWTFMWGVSIVPLMMSRFRHLQHTLFIDILTCRFRVIKKELKTIVKLTKMDSNTLVVKNFNFYQSLFKKISTIKNVYNILWETSLYLNRSFGVSQL
jgi:7tm Chemosensory receptor